MAPVVGSEVLYVPAIWHAKERMPDGSYAWEFAWKDERTGNVGPSLDPSQIDRRIMEVDVMGRGNPGSKMHEGLIYLRPRTKWKAVIIAVNSDGSCNLDINGLNGITHHRENIKEDATGKIPDTWHTGS